MTGPIAKYSLKIYISSLADAYFNFLCCLNVQMIKYSKSHSETTS